MNALGHENQPRHPVPVGAEPFVFPLIPGGATEIMDGDGARPRWTGESGFLLLADEIEGNEQPVEISPQQEPPFFPDVSQLTGKRVGNRDGGAAQHVDQVLSVGTEWGLG